MSHLRTPPSFCIPKEGSNYSKSSTIPTYEKDYNLVSSNLKGKLSSTLISKDLGMASL